MLPSKLTRNYIITFKARLSSKCTFSSNTHTHNSEDPVAKKLMLAELALLKSNIKKLPASNLLLLFSLLQMRLNIHTVDFRSVLH